MNTQLTDNEALELKALIAPSYPDLAKIEDLEKVKRYLLSLTELVLLERDDLTVLPESIGNLTQLTNLGLMDCENLTTLPESMGNLTQLTKLDLWGCKNLVTLPESIGNLTQLAVLFLGGCENLTTLPESIGNLTQLAVLFLSGCENLVTLPESMGNLTRLTDLYLMGCKSLITLPESIGNLMQLIELNLMGCENLTTLPENIGNLTELTVLDLDWCKKITTLPEPITQLNNLQTLAMNYCTNIKSLPENIGDLKSLKILSLRDCNKLENLPESICELSNLQGLNLIRCGNLTKLPNDIKKLTNLQKLYLNNCNRIDKISEDILSFVDLEHLGLCDCDNLENILENIGKLTKLKELKLWNCRKVKQLPNSIVQLKSLTQLDLSKCKNLIMLPEHIDELINLEKLNLVSCQNIDIRLLTAIFYNVDNFNNLDNISLLSIAFIFYRNSKYDIAENYFSEIKNNSTYNRKYYFYAQLFLAFIYCKKEEWHKVQQCISEVKKSTDENYIKEVMDRINSIDNNYKMFLLKILLCYLEIRELLLVNIMGILHNSQVYYEHSFAYYTKPDIAIKLLAKDENGNPKKNPFQMGSISQVNDPSEGKVIFDYFNGLDILKDNNITLKPVSEFATFVGCFTFNHNKLNQFRLYGKEQGKEATGVSVVSNYHLFNLQKHTDTVNLNQNKKNEQKIDNKDKLTLYRCIYLNPQGDLNGEPYIQVACRDEVTFYLEKGRTAEHWQEYTEDIQDIQNNVKQKFIEIKNNIQLLFLFEQVGNKKEKQSLIETVSFILMPLSYMIKHSAYQEEQECRIFQFLPFNDKKIKIENKRMYVEYLPIDSYVKKIYLSPYAEQYADMFRALSNGRVEVRSSDNPFR